MLTIVASEGKMDGRLGEGFSVPRQVKSGKVCSVHALGVMCCTVLVGRGWTILMSSCVHSLSLLSSVCPFPPFLLLSFFSHNYTQTQQISSETLVFLPFPSFHRSVLLPPFFLLSFFSPNYTQTHSKSALKAIYQR